MILTEITHDGQIKAGAFMEHARSLRGQMLAEFNIDPAMHNVCGAFARLLERLPRLLFFTDHIDSYTLRVYLDRATTPIWPIPELSVNHTQLRNEVKKVTNRCEQLINEIMLDADADSSELITCNMTKSIIDLLWQRYPQ